MSDSRRADTVPPNEMLGASVQRREDPRLISGDAEYADDIQHRHDTHLALHRSRHGHAAIDAIDTSSAEALDGVIAVYTAETLPDLEGDGRLPTDSADESAPVGQPVLAGDRVHYQGQPIAAVVANDRYTARQAADAIDVTYDRRDAVVDPEQALEDDAPTLHDAAPNNVAFEWDAGDQAAADSAIAESDNVIEVDLEINRVLPTAVEPRAAVAEFQQSTGELEVHLSSQNPHSFRSDLSYLLDLPERKIRVRSADVGGGFGAKLRTYSGYVLVARVAMEVEAPVKWTASRTEEHTSINHSRHHIIEADVGVDDDGRIHGLHAETVAPVGAFLIGAAVTVPTNLGVMAKGQYDIPDAYVHIQGAYTNTTPLSAYRGAGRPEAAYFVERMIQTVARDLDMDPVEVRRRNFIEPDQFPYDTDLGRTYDSGDYEHTMDVALGKIGYEAFRDRQAEAREQGRYLGIGISSYVEACGSSPGWSEVGEVEIAPDGTAIVKSGTAEIGTGHATAFTQIAADTLGLPAEDVEVRLGDTDQTSEGGGTAGSRAVAVGGSAIRESADTIIEKATRIAAHALEVSPADVAVDDGKFHVVGAPDQAVTLAEIAELAYTPEDLPEDIEAGLAATTHYDPENYTFTFGCHVAVVEVDPDSGEIDIERYVAVDDVGTQINPQILEGQVVGGVVQGIGQALYESVEYDANGQLTTGSLQDYAVPRAHHVPEMEWDSTVTPSPHNPLGAKGVGEAGAIGAPPAIVNAVVDALEPFEVRDIPMPLTPERVWRTIQGE